ncbi:MAG: hypothetical protein PHS79_03835 [Patescibacteria group bacterium]|nr:hypothetical protein [Patescibacteria group bacterium]
MGVFATCPEPFHGNSREGKPVKHLRQRFVEACSRLPGVFTSRCANVDLQLCGRLTNNGACCSPLSETVNPCLDSTVRSAERGSFSPQVACDIAPVVDSHGAIWLSLPRIMAELDAEEATIIREHIKDQTDEMYRTFPGLTTFGDKSPKEILDIIDRDSLLTGERGRFFRVLRLMVTAYRALPKRLIGTKKERKLLDIRERRLLEAYREQYALNGMTLKRFRALTHEAIKRTHRYIDELLDYVLVNHRAQLEFAAEVKLARDFPTLILLIAHRSGNGIISKRIPHEAAVVAILAQIEFEHMIGTYNPDRVAEIHGALVKVFVNEVFGLPSMPKVVVAELDPKNKYCVKRNDKGEPLIGVYDEDQPEAHLSTTATRYVTRLDVRVVKTGDGDGDPQVLVYFDCRIKEMIFAKLMRKLKRLPENITDHSGVILVCLSNGPEVELLVNRLRAKLVTNPGQVWAQKSNAARAGAVDPNNPHSSVDRRGETYLFRWGGITHELQMLDLVTFIESKICRDRRAHLVYKFLTLIDTAFPFIWPTCYYGKDWMDADLRGVLWEFVIRKLWTGPSDLPANDTRPQSAAA